MHARIRGGTPSGGGVVGYPLSALYEEVAFVAYHFHWPVETILSLEHGERQRWLREISSINQRSNAEGQDASKRENLLV